jgi:hypothetical protein
MRVVDNSRNGNCLYNAYAVSLMSHLKSLAQDNPLRNEIFDLFRLSEAERFQLHRILNTPRYFTYSDKKIIESIMSPKLRLAAATSLISEFSCMGDGSSLFASMSFEFRRQISGKLTRNWQGLAPYISVATDPNVVRTYREADIYRVPGITIALEKYINVIMSEFYSLNEANQETVDKLLKEEVVHFLTKNNEEYLQKYFNLLNQNGFWGTDETLFALHRFVSGEKTLSINSKKEVFAQRPISLQVYKNGKIVSSMPSIHSGDIVLDNQSKGHWVSFIPIHKDLEILSREQPSNALIHDVLVENNEIDMLLTAYLTKPIQNFGYMSREKALKAGLVKTALDYKERLLTDFLQAFTRPIGVDEHLCQKLIQLKSVLKTLFNDQITQAEKIRCLELFELQARKEQNGWGRLQKYISAFLIAAVSVSLGILLGAAIGGVLFTTLGPGATLIGAIWGAFKGGNIGIISGTLLGAAIGLNSSLRVTKGKSKSDPMTKEYAQLSKNVFKKTNTIPLNKEEPQLQDTTRRIKLESKKEKHVPHIALGMQGYHMR